MSFFDVVFKRQREDKKQQYAEGSAHVTPPNVSDPVEDTQQTPPPHLLAPLSEARSNLSRVSGRQPSVASQQHTVGKKDSSFRTAEHNATARQVFLAPLPRRRMVMPEGVMARMRASERDEEWAAVRDEDGPRAPTPLSSLSATLTSRLANESIVVNEAELAGVKRLASFNAPVRKDSIPITLPTSGYNLKWLHDPAKHKRPFKSSTLVNLRTDYLLPKSAGGGGGGEYDRYPFIDSPRSVLVLVRNGAHPMDLQQRPSTGASALGAYREMLRRDELVRLQSEYSAICDVLPQTTLDAFYSFFSNDESTHHEGGHGSGANKSSSEASKSQVVKPMLEKDDNGIYRVAFHFEVSTAAAAVEDQMDRTRANLRALLEAEIALTTSRTDALRVQQERSLAAARKHDGQIAERQQQRHVAATIKAIATKQRALNRAEAAERLRQQTIDAYNAKQERLAQQEERIEEMTLQRQGERRSREEDREERRLQTLALAADNEAKLMSERVLLVQRKNASCQEAMESKAKELQVAKDKKAVYERGAAARKAVIDQRAETDREIRRQQQEKREAAAEAQIAKLREQQSTEAAVRNLASLQKLVYMDECRVQNEEVERQRLVDLTAQQEVAEERQQRLLSIIDQRRKGRHIAREEARMEKALRVERQSRIDQFNSLMTADRMLESKARAEAVTIAREERVKEAQHEREMLSQWRHKALTEAKKEAEEQERKATLSIFNKAHPSDAVIYADRNARTVSSILMQPLRKRRPLSYSSGEPAELLE